jgi:hypothetical protein
MITKERLEELIEQGATIYELYMNNNIIEIQLKNDWYVMRDGLYEAKLGKHPFRSWWISNLYETKEDADFVREFGCIERTERLELPTWEEFWNSGQTIWFTGKDGGQYGLSQYNREILLNDSYIGYLDKESYYKACRKCKEIFLGEKK